MKKTPLAQAKEKFSAETAKDAKKKLIAEVEQFTKGDELWVNRINADKGLAHVSNAKLLRLHAIFTEVKAKFGTRAKLIAQIAELEKRSKDDGYKTHLSAFPVPRLFDLWKSSTKRHAEKKPAVRKAEAPKPAVKKVAKAAQPVAKKGISKNRAKNPK
jgi:hypothetical protein